MNLEGQVIMVIGGGRFKNSLPLKEIDSSVYPEEKGFCVLTENIKKF